MKHLHNLAYIALLIPLKLFANPFPDWSISFNVEQMHQSIGNNDTDITTLTFSPSIQFADWSLNATLPWQKVEGSYFINNLYPNLARLCGQINGLTTLQKLLLLQQGKITQSQIDYCSKTNGIVTSELSDSNSGFGDLNLVATYYLPASNTSIYGSVAIGYKHDNGDELSGLGSGTRDAYLETTWQLDKNKVGFAFTAGYNHVINNASGIDLNDNLYIVTEAEWTFHDRFSTGLAYQYQQANIDGIDGTKQLTSSIRLKDKTWGARLFVSSYFGEEGYPDAEFGGSISYWLE